MCPSRILTQSGQASVADHASIFQANNCQAATLANDAALGSYTGDGLVCGDSPATLAVELQNMGLENLTSCTITAYDNGTEIASTDWMGNLETYAFAEVTVVTTTTIDASTEFTFEITSGRQRRQQRRGLRCGGIVSRDDHQRSGACDHSTTGQVKQVGKCCRRQRQRD